MSEWRLIEQAPSDLGMRGGLRPDAWVKDRDGCERLVRRAIFNNSGWMEVRTNREVWPVWWLDTMAAAPKAASPETGGNAGPSGD